MSITGWRRLIFGLFSVSCVTAVEAFTEGWTKPGAVAIILVPAQFYGDRIIKALTELVAAAKGHFSKKEDGEG